MKIGITACRPRDGGNPAGVGVGVVERGVEGEAVAEVWSGGLDPQPFWKFFSEEI